MNNEIILLKQNLSQFGLNPKDWSVQKKQGALYLIKNKTSKSLTLKGLATKKDHNINWKYLNLETL